MVPATRPILVALWRAALAACDGAALVEERLRRRPPGGPVFLFALGKPAGPMAAGAARALGRRLEGGLIVGPAGSAPARPAGKMRFIEGAHPWPDARSAAAGRSLWRAASSLPGKVEPLVLLAGGGSALAVLPARGLPLAAKLAAHQCLVRSGLPIQSMNAVRSHLSRLKGGGLLRAFGRRPVRVLVLSDVGAGDVESVASGPCSPDTSTFADCLEIVRRLRLPAAAKAYLEAGARGERPETVKPGDPLCRRARLVRLAGPMELRDAAAAAARRMGFRVVVRSAPFAGPWSAVREELARWLAAPAPSRPTVLVSVGEAQVALPPRAGRGGRAQQLALSLLPCLDRSSALLIAGSDGRDGQSPFAGAAADAEDLRRALASGVDIRRALRTFDAASAVAELGIGLPAEPPRTNLTDLFLLARGPSL
ncbi:MAG: DUF4147 domain-containing protein [Myxococcales bacterium]